MRPERETDADRSKLRESTVVLTIKCLLQTGFVIAERILYLPSIGYCIAVTAIVGALLQASSKPARWVG